jgi:ketosteroid isomerase-like protein
MDSAQVVRRFEREFKNNATHGIVDELMSEDFIRHLPYQGLPAGRAGMRAVGELVTSAIHDIHMEIPLILTEGDLVADRIEAAGVRAGTGTPLTWVENHTYRVADGQITELWPAGGPPAQLATRLQRKAKEDARAHLSDRPLPGEPRCGGQGQGGHREVRRIRDRA